MRRGSREPDDVLRVYYRPDGVYRVNYRDGDANTSYSCEYTGRELWTYLLNLFYMVTIDAYPFRQVQISGAGYPSVIYSIADLEYGNSPWSNLMDVVWSSCFTEWTTPADTPSELSSQTTTPIGMHTVP